MKNDTKNSTKSKTATFSAEERAAMRERVKEQKAAAGKVDGEKDVLAKIAGMPKAEATMAKRVHEIIKASAPGLSPKLWYGQPAYAKDGKVLCFFQNAGKFKTRYSTLGFSDEAKLDNGSMWPTSYALTELTAADEKKIGALVKKAVG
jgi:uncharacterized protein YdhG (YjbR/CyaY superfamily)